MSRQRVPGDGPKCWCGSEAILSGYCRQHIDENFRTTDRVQYWRVPDSKRLSSNQVIQAMGALRCV